MYVYIYIPQVNDQETSLRSNKICGVCVCVCVYLCIYMQQVVIKRRKTIQSIVHALRCTCMRSCFCLAP